MSGTNEKTAAGLVAHAAAQEGMAYWYGTFGQAPTQALLDEKRKQYPSMYAAANYNLAKAHVGAKGKRVYDCAGLVKSYWMQPSPTAPPVYRAAYDLSAHGLYQVCAQRGAIAGLPETPGALVFIYEAKRGAMGHVGVCLGGGQVVDAANFTKGVKKDALKIRGWTHWGLLPEAWLGYGTAMAWKPGDRARVKPGTREYSPGVPMASWVPGQAYTVSQVADSKGKEVVRGGKRCVLLKEVNSWCAVDYLEKA
ncbi:MAG: C40 family peptidase [Oscillospiraceae bacterium]|jgi:hypothetical protein|nr:C40 family peptidase [Oscillospiraceae bacterium]